MSTEPFRALEARIDELEFRLTLPRVMNLTQLCEFLGISKRNFYELKDRGDTPPAIYLSQRAIRFDVHDVMTWLKAKKVGGQV